MSRSQLLPFMLMLLVLSLGAEERNKLQPGILEGISLESNIYSKMYNVSGARASQWDLTFMPTLHYRTEGNMEFAPYLMTRLEIESNDDNAVSTNLVHTDLKRISVGAGSGFYWNLLDTKHIDVISGFRTELAVIFPQWGGAAPTGHYDLNDPGKGSLAAMLDVPMGFELQPLEHLRFRLWVEMLRFGVRMDEDYYRDDIIDRTFSFFSYSPFWDSAWTPSSYEDWVPYSTPISFSLIWNL